MVCPICIALPLALIGGGASGTNIGKKQLWKKVVMWIGVILLTLASIIFIYYLINKKKCSSCISY